MKNTPLFLAALFFFAFISCTKYRNVPSKYGGTFVAPAAGKIAFGSLRINEFMCKGTDAGAVALFDQATAKWFELYNPTSADIALTPGQWYISDDLTSTTKFAIPTNTAGAQWVVPAKGFLAVMCNKSDGSTTADPKRINTGFSLSSTAGSIGIFYQETPSASVLAVDTLNYDYTSIGGALSGVSYGRPKDGDNPNNLQLSKVTPEASNN